MVSVLVPVSLLAGVLLLIPVLFGQFTAYQIGLYLIYGITAQGIGFLWGKTGVLPLGQALFFGVAAYATAMVLQMQGGLFFQLSMSLLVLVIIALFAFILASQIFRGRSDSGPYFSLITLALVMIGEQVANTATDLTGGFNGLGGYGSLGGLDPFGGFYYAIVAATVGVTLVLFLLNRLPVNLVALAVCDNEPRLQLLGFPTHIIKGAAFAFSAAIAALAGILFASQQGIVTPTATGFALSAELVILTAVGGRFHVLGPLIGAVIVGWTSAQLRDSFRYWELCMAIAFIVVVLKAPGGIAELLEMPFRRLLSFRNKIRVPSFNLEAPDAKTPSIDGTIQFKDARLSVGAVHILNGVSFETPQSGIVSIIGPNGAGKTTALNAITGNLPLTSGTIELGGKRIDSRPPYKALGSGIGRKLQVPSVFFSLSVSDNLAIAMMANRAKLADFFNPKTFHWRSGALSHLLANDAIPLQTELDQLVAHLPQGHRQFLEYAMTIAAEPSILLLDEPCAGLSPGETLIMTNLVSEYQSATASLVIMIEHDMSIVEAISDKVLVLHNGQVLAFDAFEVVRSNPKVQEVYVGGTK